MFRICSEKRKKNFHWQDADFFLIRLGFLQGFSARSSLPCKLRYFCPTLTDGSIYPLIAGYFPFVTMVLLNGIDLLKNIVARQKFDFDELQLIDNLIESVTPEQH